MPYTIKVMLSIREIKQEKSLLLIILQPFFCLSNNLLKITLTLSKCHDLD